MPKKNVRYRHNDLRLELIQAILDYRSEALMAATIAGCAIIAHADGEAAPAERRRMLEIMRAEPLLSVFPRDNVLAEFEAHDRTFNDDPVTARAAALDQVRPMASHPRLARIVLKACVAIAHADEFVHRREVEAIILICRALALPPEDSGAWRWLPGPDDRGGRPAQPASAQMAS